MTAVQIGILGCVMLFVLLAASMPVAFAMAVVGFAAFANATGKIGRAHV